MERGGRGDPECVLTSSREGRRWPNLGRRQEDSGGDMRLGLLPRDPPRVPGDGVGLGGVRGWHAGARCKGQAWATRTGEQRAREEPPMEVGG
jgi:hypothetical protein